MSRDELISELCSTPHGEYHTDLVRLKFMEVARLERIATALEGINDSLSDMQQSLEVLEALTECISSTKYGNMICITGSVDTRNY